MTLQTSGPISMNEINREMKGYTASGTPIDLNDIQFRKMAAASSGALNSTAAISLGDFYGDRSHIRLSTASHTSTGTTTIIYNGYYKGFFSNGSDLGSIHSSAGVYIPSSGDTLNQFTEREVLECYTIDYTSSSTSEFYLKLAVQIYSQNTFTGIKELNTLGWSTGMGTKALADATFSSASTFNTWDQWKWTTTNRWTSGTKYIHWY